jgi:hypothetical protein
MKLRGTEVDGISWNSMELHGKFLSWNFVNSWNLMKFGFDRVGTRGQK